MMYYRHPQLGLIPDYQFSTDPAVNPHINPHVTYPEGMYQTTTQPIGPYYNPPPPPPCPSCVAPGVKGLGIDNPFDSWWWENRQWLALGALAVVGIGAIALIGVVLK